MGTLFLRLLPAGAGDELDRLVLEKIEGRDGAKGKARAQAAILTAVKRLPEGHRRRCLNIVEALCAEVPKARAGLRGRLQEY